MKYLLNVYAQWGPAGAPIRNPRGCLRCDESFVQAARDSGELVGMHALADPSTSTVVRVRKGVPVVTEGPYQAAGTYVTAYYVLDCESRERAWELAARHPAAHRDGVEVRPLMIPAGLEM